MADFDWSDNKKVEQFKNLHAAGLSFSEIAAEMGGGLTRNAAIGKARRLGLPSRKGENSTSHQTNPQQTIRKAAKSATIRPERPKAANKPPVMEVDAGEEKKKLQKVFEPIDGSEQPITEQTEGRCSWPIDIPNSRVIQFCGAKTITLHSTKKDVGGRDMPIEKPSPYCAAHSRMAFKPPSARKPQGYRSRYDF